MLDRLDAAIKSAGVPILGVSGSTGGPVRIDFAPGATGQQKLQAHQIVDSFDWSPATDANWRDIPERKSLRQAAAAAIQTNNDFIALPSATNAQLTAQVKALSQQNNAIIRRLVQID